MAHEILGNGTGPKAERFSETVTAPLPPPQQSQPLQLTGYIALGPDENGVIDFLFAPMCRRIQIMPPTPDCAAETIRILIEDQEWIQFGPLQSLEFMYRWNIRRRPPVEESRIIVPDTVKLPGLLGT